MEFSIDNQTFKPVFQLIPAISSEWTHKDLIGTMKVRWGIGRDHYTLVPGLYRIGNPDSQSDVFVSANYKLSFDHLRKNLAGLNAWVLVIVFRNIEKFLLLTSL
jgi:hypothetical protein